MTPRQRLIEIAASRMIEGSQNIDALIEGVAETSADARQCWYGKSETAKERLVQAIVKRYREIRKWKR